MPPKPAATSEAKPAAKPAAKRAKIVAKTVPSPARPGKNPSKSQVNSLIAELRSLGSESFRTAMAERYGIRLPDPSRAFGVRVSDLKVIVKRIRKERGRDHSLAQALWDTGYYEARMLACFIDDPKAVTAAQMNRWVKDFDNWGICDTACFHLFDKIGTDRALTSAEKWSTSTHEFIKRAAFALIASLALHDKKAPDEPFLRALQLIDRASDDDRNFVKKAVSWALRGIGKRGGSLKSQAITLAHDLASSDDRTKRWIGKDALRDLQRPAKVKRPAKK